MHTKKQKSMVHSKGKNLQETNTKETGSAFTGKMTLKPLSIMIKELKKHKDREVKEIRKVMNKEYLQN